MNENITKVLDAYETLSDKDTRLKYDQSLGSSSAEIEEIVRSMTEQKSIEQRGMFVNQGVKKNVHNVNDRMDADMIHWAYRALLSMFLIITVPKVLYIAYSYIVDGVLPF